jgi:heme exporter protein CcmD
MNEFVSMGGYGGYVWPAYLISALLIGGLVYLVLRRAARARRRLLALSADKNSSAAATAPKTD